MIAIDGSLFRFHPHFKNVMQSRISQLMGINFKFDLLLSEVSSQTYFTFSAFHICLKLKIQNRLIILMITNILCCYLSLHDFLTDHAGSAGFAFITFIPGWLWTRRCPGCSSSERKRVTRRSSSSQFLLVSELPRRSSKPAVTRPPISKKFSRSTNCVHQISKIPKPKF